MKFTPKSKEELAADGLLPDGEYDFEIVSAEDAISKAGNEMIKLRLNIFDGGGRPHVMWDYLMASVAFKLRHCAEACGLTDQYDAGELDAIDFEGKTGRCKVNIQKDKSGQYPDRNGIKDYLVSNEPAAIAERVARTQKSAGGGPSVDDLNDAIPFAPCWQ